MSQGKQYMGQQVHKYEKLVNRNFAADRPNAKWVTDISYIHTRQGVRYLSMIPDLYDTVSLPIRPAPSKPLAQFRQSKRLWDHHD